MSEARDQHFIADHRRQVERLSKLGWYHSIELPDGSVIPGHQSLEQQRERLRQFHIPEDLTGKRVLDIGAWDGWFSFEMERRGASVMAVDAAKNTRLLEAKALLGSRIDYHVADICLSPNDIGTFDIVLFLGVLYHLKHPLLALENVCGLCRDMACVESFVTDASPEGVPAMEFYETAELRGQLDNWCGPNIACLLAFTRTAGFARVQFESVLAGRRAHVSAWRQWNGAEGGGEAPRIRCVENSATHDHNFSAAADDYLTFYFLHADDSLTCDNVYPEIGGYGARPLYVAKAGGGWQASCKLPPGLGWGWHAAKLRVEGSRWSAAAQIGVDVSRRNRRPASASELRISRIADGKVFESGRVRVGEDSAISVWVAGLPSNAAVADIGIRLNGTDLPAIWLGPAADEQRQINALLPAGLEPGSADVSVVFNGAETPLQEIALYL